MPSDRDQVSSGASVRIRNAVKQYRDARALDGVDLDVQAGEFLTLLGSSGSGKSTLLNIVAGFIACDDGSVEVDGVDITRMPPHKRGLGVVFQNYALFPHMSVFDNVAFPLRRRRVPRSRMREMVHEALGTVELGDLAARMPAQLSGGQQQRVALARAIVFQPRVLLMDEPLGALDKRLREQLQLEVKRLHQELGITFVFVTHDQQEALVMSDRIALLRAGSVVQVGPPQELYDAPTELYAAEFLGESNTFRGELVGDELHTTACPRALKVDPGAQVADGPRALVVRPERIELRADENATSDGHGNSVSGVVREVSYLGSGYRVAIELGDGTLVVARTSSDDRFTPGQPVVARWRPDHGLLVDDRRTVPQPT